MRWNEFDHDFAVAVAEAFDIEVPQSEKPNPGKKTEGEQPFSFLSPNNGFSATGRRIAIFALDGFDSLQVSGMVAAVTAIGSIPNVIGFVLLSSTCRQFFITDTSFFFESDRTRKGPAFPRGVKKGDQNASGVIQTNFTLESARSTLFDALFIPDGDENFIKQLKSGRALHWLREATAHFKTSAFRFCPLTFRKADLNVSIRSLTVGAVGSSIPVLAHKALPGDLDLKADLSESYSSKNGFVLAQNLAGDEASMWQKVKGVKDLAGFGYAFFDAVSQHRHWSESFFSYCLPLRELVLTVSSDE